MKLGAHTFDDSILAKILPPHRLEGGVLMPTPIPTLYGAYEQLHDFVNVSLPLFCPPPPDTVDPKWHPLWDECCHVICGFCKKGFSLLAYLMWRFLLFVNVAYYLLQDLGVRLAQYFAFFMMAI